FQVERFDGVNWQLAPSSDASLSDRTKGQGFTSFSDFAVGEVATGNNTTTSVACLPASVVVNQSSTCTATVTDTSGTPSAPAGTVSFARSGAGAGSFSAPSCTLSPVDSTSSSCFVDYTPSAGSGIHTVTATYVPTSAHKASAGNANITVSLRSTQTTISCVAASLVVSFATSCTATVTDTSASGTKSSPA